MADELGKFSDRLLIFQRRQRLGELPYQPPVKHVVSIETRKRFGAVPDLTEFVSELRKRGLRT